MGVVGYWKEDCEAWEFRLSRSKFEGVGDETDTEDGCREWRGVRGEEGIVVAIYDV